ncbi:hypothetical protein GCM10017708_16020 [Arthrobacter citreus]
MTTRAARAEALDAADVGTCVVSGIKRFYGSRAGRITQVNVSLVVETDPAGRRCNVSYSPFECTEVVRRTSTGLSQARLIPHNTTDATGRRIEPIAGVRIKNNAVQAD